MKRIKFLNILTVIIFITLSSNIATKFAQNIYKVKNGTINQKQDLKIKNIKEIQVENYYIQIADFLEVTDLNDQFIIPKDSIIKIIRIINKKYALIVYNQATYLAKLSNLKIEKQYKQNLQNQQLKSLNLQQQNKTIQFAITIDLCSPSSTEIKWEQELFMFLASLSKKYKKPIPVAIAISDNWIKKSLPYLQFIKNLQQKSYLKITWVNHSFHHHLNTNEEGEFLFLTKNPDEFFNEVLENEKSMIQNNLIPSEFFRFPGLTSNNDLQNQLNQLSLTELNANGWINKGQKLDHNKIILLHGNGNEHSGVVKFIQEFNQAEEEEKINETSFIDITQLTSN